MYVCFLFLFVFFLCREDFGCLALWEPVPNSDATGTSSDVTDAGDAVMSGQREREIQSIVKHKIDKSYYRRTNKTDQ